MSTKKQYSGSVHSFPAPAVVIGCGTLDKPNLITCSWFGTVCSDPPQVSVSIRKNRFSYQPVHEIFEFTVNIPFSKDIEVVKLCGTKSGRDINKFTELGITPVPCPPLETTPMVKEFPLVLGCKVKHEINLGSHNMFIAEVLSIHCDEDLVRKNNKPNPTPEEQIVYLDKRYWSLVELSGIK